MVRGWRRQQVRHSEVHKKGWGEDVINNGTKKKISTFRTLWCPSWCRSEGGELPPNLNPHAPAVEEVGYNVEGLVRGAFASQGRQANGVVNVVERLKSMDMMLAADLLSSRCLQISVTISQRRCSVPHPR